MSRSLLFALVGVVPFSSLLIAISSGCGDSTPSGPPSGPATPPAAKAFYPGDPEAKSNPAVQNQKK